MAKSTMHVMMEGCALQSVKDFANVHTDSDYCQRVRFKTIKNLVISFSVKCIKFA